MPARSCVADCSASCTSQRHSLDDLDWLLLRMCIERLDEPMVLFANGFGTAVVPPVEALRAAELRWRIVGPDANLAVDVKVGDDEIAGLVTETGQRIAAGHARGADTAGE